MKILRIDPNRPEPLLLEQAADYLKTGRPLIFPTDTVYGIGVTVQAGTSLESVYAIKGRDLNKAIPWLVASSADLLAYGKNVPQYALDLAKRYWPGALTLIVLANKSVSADFCAEDGSIALRAPASSLVLALLEQVAAPIAASSANVQGQAPAVAFADLDKALIRHIGMAIDGGACPLKEASTIVSCLGEKPAIIRKGSLQIELEEFIR